jgi:hypothetical protein
MINMNILKFKDFFKKKEVQKIDCIMFDVKINEWNDILTLINEDDLYTDINDTKNNFGKEFDTHITLIYGIHSSIDNKNKSIDFLKNINKFKIHLTNVSYFENDEYNVLKIDVISKYLQHLRKKIINLIPNTQTFLNYNPHITIAYLRKDVDINKYIENINKYIENIEKDYIIEEAIYSDFNHEKEYIKIDEYK